MPIKYFEDKKPNRYSVRYMETIIDFHLKNPTLDLCVLTGVFLRGYQAAIETNLAISPKRLYDDVVNCLDMPEEIKQDLLKTLNPHFDNIGY